MFMTTQKAEELAMQNEQQEAKKTAEDIVQPLNQELLDAIFQPQEFNDSEAVNVGRSYYGGEWGKRR